MRFLLVFSGFCVCVIGGLLAVGFYIVDGQVTARLASSMETNVSAIYSDITRVDPLTPLERVETQLLKRRYRKVDQDPNTPGEFYLTARSLQVYTREFSAPDGRSIPAQKVIWGAQKDRRPFALEPQAISVLGESTRSSKNRSLSAFPNHLVQAIVAIEDERFRKHIGLDFEGILRAALTNLQAGRVVQGGSTITQQLAKNLLFTRERSFKRKILEALAALSLERHLSKAEILQMYLNEVYLGQEGAVALHGVESAASAFLGKTVEQLTLPESALLAGMIQAPSLYSPRRHPERAKARRAVVLKKMRERGYITEKQLRLALNSPLNIIKERFHQRRAPHFVTEVSNSLVGLFGEGSFQGAGIKVFTGLDMDLQQCAEEAVSSSIETLEATHKKLVRGKKSLEVGLVALEPFSGKVRAWVGGRDYASNQFDHVAQAERQIGSTIKPFLYLTALDGSLNSYRVATPISILTDEPVKIDLVSSKAWAPENYDHEFRGDVTLRYALERSLNIPAVQILTRVGIPSFVQTLERFRLGSHIPEVHSLALGALDTSLLNLTASFGALANGGVYVGPRAFVSVLDRDLNRIGTSDIVEERVANEAPVFVLTDILRGVVDRGTGTSIRASGYTGVVAGKTGTSNETRDLWFVGFSPDLVTGVWVGYDDNAKVGLTGGTGAAPIWAEFMKCASTFGTPSSFIAPTGVVAADIDISSGLRVNKDCPGAQTTREIFVAGTEPRTRCEIESAKSKEGPESSEHPREEEGSEEEEPRRSFFERIFGL